MYATCIIIRELHFIEYTEFLNFFLIVHFFPLEGGNRFFVDTPNGSLYATIN